MSALHNGHRQLFRSQTKMHRAWKRCRPGPAGGPHGRQTSPPSSSVAPRLSSPGCKCPSGDATEGEGAEVSGARHIGHSLEPESSHAVGDEASSAAPHSVDMLALPIPSTRATRKRDCATRSCLAQSPGNTTRCGGGPCSPPCCETGHDGAGGACSRLYRLITRATWLRPILVWYLGRCVGWNGGGVGLRKKR